MTYYDIFDMVIDAAVTALLISLSISLLYGIVLKIKRKKLSNVSHVFIQLFYFSMLFYITIFRGDLITSPSHSINVVPFIELKELFLLQKNVLGIETACITLIYNILGNIIWFIPLGMISLRSHQFNFFQTICMGFFISFMIEFLQYVLYTGISDIDDLIFNVVGTMIGFIIYKLMQRRT